MIKSLDEIEKEISVIEERIENFEDEICLIEDMVCYFKRRLKSLLDEKDLCLRGMDKYYD